MRVLSANRLLWLFALLLVAALAVSTVRSLTEEKSDERSGGEEFFEEGLDNFEYDGLDESDIDKPEYAGQHPPPPPPPQYSQPPPPPTGEYGPPPPPPPPQHYEQPPAYSQPPPPPPPPPRYPEPVQSAYPAPQVESYSQLPLPQPPVYQPPAYQPPAYQPSYEAPAINYTQPAYPQPQQTYQPVYPAPVANYSQPAYQPVQETYQQPQQTYQQPQQTYQQPQQTYQPVYPAPVVNYTQQTYQPVQQTYQPVYPAQVSTNYSQPAYQPPKQVYQAPVVNYTAPTYTQQQQQVPVVVSKPANYSVATYTAPVVQQQQVYSPAALAQRYSVADLAPFTTPFGYRGNHWSLYYYRSLPYKTQCLRYPNGLGYREIENAFASAVAQLGGRTGPSYMNSSAPSFAARHQIFSFLSQQNARMDEEGLLLELASLHLADRVCMTKWDRQRYLPSLTRIVSASQFPSSHSCSQYYSNPWSGQSKNCYQSRYRTYDGFCNNPYHPYWGKSNVCHIRLLSPDYSDGLSMPREAANYRYPLPNPRVVANVVNNDIPLEGPYNLMKMQWGQFINHDISNTALSSYDGLVDCCKQPHTRGCWPMMVPPGDRFYGPQNVTCLNFIRSGVCPTCQLGPRQQTNKNTAFLDGSQIYGNNHEQANQLRTFQRGQLRTSGGRGGEQLLPIASSQEQCTGVCYQAGDSRVNQHPALTALHTLLVRNHNRHAHQLAIRHPNWNDETLFQEARRINIAEYQMITYNEYLPIVFGPILSAYFQLTPQRGYGYTQYNPKVDPTTWNEYTTAACRFGHSQISSTFGLYSRILGYGQVDQKQPTFRLREWFMRPSLIADGLLPQIINGLLAKPSLSVDPWVTTDVRNHLYQSPAEKWGGDLAATNIWRGRDHGLPGYVHYLEYCFNYRVRGWKELQLFIPNYTLNQLRKLYKVVENIDLFSGGLAERHFPGADIGPTFACINGIQYNHLKYGDRFYFEHGGQAGSFNPGQLEEIKRATLARLLCRTAQLPAAPQYAFLQPSLYNPLINCSQVGDIDYNRF